MAMVMQEKNKPWKTIGYRGFSTFLDSENDFLVFRRFGSLNARILLLLQDEIAQIEEHLEELENIHSRPEAEDIHNGSFRQETLVRRTELLHQAHGKIEKYNALLIQQSDLRSRPHVPKHNINSISNWLYNTTNAIPPEETNYINKTSDLIQVVVKSTTPLRALLERFSRFRRSRLWRTDIPQSVMTIPGYPEKSLHYSSETRINTAMSIVIISLGMIMLILPLWVLAITNGTMERLGIITTFIVVFLGLLAFTTAAKPFESLAATAAYTAVLVVFLQTSEQTSPSQSS